MKSRQAKSFSLMAAGDIEVDLMMVFDTEAAAWALSNAGGVAAMANSAVARMNTALSDSDIPCREPSHARPPPASPESRSPHRTTPKAAAEGSSPSAASSHEQPPAHP